MTSPKPPLSTRSRHALSRDLLSGESADVYFARAEEILAKEGLRSAGRDRGR